MQLTIDNLTGSGPVDYSTSINDAKGISIKRLLNEPSQCTFSFLPDSQQLSMPARYARVTVADSLGNILFTGYVAAPPAMVLAGGGITGASYQAEVTAISDELLLDSGLTTSAGTAVNQPISTLLQNLARVTTGTAVTLSTSGSDSVAGRVTTKAGATWSVAAGAAAATVRSAYGMVNGTVSVNAIGSTSHILSEASGTLLLSELSTSAVKLLANDVTVCGKVEPAAFVTEIFQGDGTTTAFTLTELPFTPISSEKLTISDLFQGSGLNNLVWQWVDSSSRLSVTSNGVTCSGGTGRDAETVLNAIQEMEIGGSTVLEAGGVQISAGSTGILMGLYAGAVASSNCSAGFSISESGGAVQVSAIVQGAAAGSSVQLAPGGVYTLRIRIYSPEMERVRPSYYYLNGTGTGSIGGDVVVAPGHLVLEVQNFTSGVAGANTVLYDGTLTIMPPICVIGLINSGALTCSIKTFSCTQARPEWITLTPSGGTATTQRIDTAANGGACTLGTTGKLTFNAANVPPADAVISVNYRTEHRAVARRSTSITSSASTSSATPATQMWIGSVTAPTPWSSIDCDNAAQALLQSSAAASAAWAGTYTGWNLEANGDIWPGNLLVLQSASAGLDVSVVVREVLITIGSSAPQSVKYAVKFANDWAEDLAIKLSATVPVDTLLPAAPAIGGTPLNSLMYMKVTAVTGTEIQIDTGASAPAGGGFEVKRKDWTFGPGTDSDLVLRSPAENFIIPRVAPMEQYYIRMYDGSTPPNYSAMSAAVFVNVPLGGS